MSYEGYDGFTITAQHEGQHTFGSPFDSLKLLQDSKHKPAEPTSSKHLVDVKFEVTSDKSTPPAVPSNTEKKPPSFESWGRSGRKYAVDADGNAAYEVKRGDTYASVARDVLEKRNGRKFDFRNEKDKAEILRLSKELAAFNEKKWGSKDRVIIRPGDQIRIPAQKKQEAQKLTPAPQVKPSAHEAAKDAAKDSSKVASKDAAKDAEKSKEQTKGNEANKPKPPEAPKEPQVMAGSTALQPHEKLYNLLQPPGFEGFPGQPWSKEIEGPGKAYDIDRRQVTNSRQLANGANEYAYSGKVETNGFFGTGIEFQSREVVDAQGRILVRQMHYEKAVTMKLAIPGMENKEQKIVSIESIFDPKSGTYDAQYTTKEGLVLRGRLSADGRPLRQIAMVL